MIESECKKTIKKVYLVRPVQWFYTGRMSIRVLCAWLGQHDIDGASGKSDTGIGPIASALESGEFERLMLLSNYPARESRFYADWARSRFPSVETDLSVLKLTSPTAYGEIYRECDQVLRDLTKGEHELTFHLSPGTPAMASVWILLASGPYRARLIETSRQAGMGEVNLPFEISARFRPGQILEGKLSSLNESLLPPHPAFESIIHSTEEMQKAVFQARKAAAFDIPVLLLGESGTGKELFSKAIHDASERKEGPFVAVNCGAIPPSLAESALFGHAKGSFTGASEGRPGYVEQADGGTLFLDEIGELPLDIQVKLLRVLNDRKVMRLGESRVRMIDFRLISATNRNLLEERRGQRFRPDLYHRIAVGVIKLPPLRARTPDMGPVCDHILKNLNREFGDQEGWKSRTLSPDGLEALKKHSWPGNIRELINTLTRAAIFHSSEVIDGPAVTESIIDTGSGISGGCKEILDRPIGGGFCLEDIIGEVARHYLQRGLHEAQGKKKAAAELLGFSNYQTLDNWLKRYGLGEDGE
jgi:transcriptional regulator with PAS, ATPase and Fis domain